MGAAGSRKLGGRAVEGPAEEFVLYLLKEERKSSPETAPSCRNETSRVFTQGGWIKAVGPGSLSRALSTGTRSVFPPGVAVFKVWSSTPVSNSLKCSLEAPVHSSQEPFLSA